MIAWLVVLVSLLGTNRGGGEEAPFTEYRVKALFLFNFAKYVDWPATIFSSPSSPFTIGVLGQDVITKELKRAVEAKSINGRSILVKSISTDAELTACHILFISGSEKSRVDEILAKTGALPILTVGEQDNFLQKSGIINFTLKEGKVRLEINLDAARQAHVQISSKLLSVADLVKGKAN